MPIYADGPLIFTDFKVREISGDQRPICGICVPSGFLYALNPHGVRW